MLGFCRFEIRATQTRRKTCCPQKSSKTCETHRHTHTHTHSDSHLALGLPRSASMGCSSSLKRRDQESSKCCWSCDRLVRILYVAQAVPEPHGQEKGFFGCVSPSLQFGALSARARKPARGSPLGFRVGPQNGHRQQVQLKSACEEQAWCGAIMEGLSGLPF